MRKYGLKMNPLKCAFGVSAGKFLGFIIHEAGIEIDPAKIERPSTIPALPRVPAAQHRPTRIPARATLAHLSLSRCHADPTGQANVFVLNLRPWHGKSRPAIPAIKSGH